MSDEGEARPLLGSQEPRGGCRHWLLFPIVVLYFMSVGIGFFVINEWIHHYVKTELISGANMSAMRGCLAHNKSDPDFIAFRKVQERTALWQMYVSLAATPVMAVLCVLPSLSDSVGRKFLFVCGIFGSFSRVLITAAVIYFRLNLIYIVVVTILASFTGSSYTFVSAASSYVADVTVAGKQRTVALTVLEGLMMVCITLSGLVAGYLIKYCGFLSSGIIACILGLLALLMTIFTLPETLPPDRRANTLEIIGNMKRTVYFYTNKQNKDKRTAYLLLIGAYLFTELASSHRGSIEMLYQLGAPFCWSAVEIGYFTTIRHAVQGLAGIVLVVPLKKLMSDRTIAVISTLFNAGSFVLEGLAKSRLLLYLVAVPATLSFLAIPMVKSLMCNMTPKEKQGSLFASILVVQNMCVVIDSLVLNLVYRATVSIFNGFVFLLLAGISMISFLLLLIFSVQQRKMSTQRRLQVNRSEAEAISTG